MAPPERLELPTRGFEDRHSIQLSYGGKLVVNDRIELSLQAYETRVRTTGFTMAGMDGFEPPNTGIKIRGLTAWRHPNNLE